MSKYEAVIGLEVHAQLSTATKMFCSCSTRFGEPPNTQVCPVCLGLPGALPAVNRTAIEYAVRMGLATDCSIAEESIFARKNYFYPDCPKDYQISQFDTPICADGHLMVLDGSKRIGITRIHMEEDAGKLVHVDGAEYSFVDMNRSGVPLIEIVSEPDIRTAEEAAAYVTKIRSIVRYLEVSDGDMEKGNLRCDVNVSLRLTGAEELGTKTEVKNLNSFKQVQQSIEFEIKRQTKVLDEGGRIAQDTLLWDAAKNIATVMRSKEEAHDYRYFPEPDLGVVYAGDDLTSSIAKALPELPDAKSARFVVQHKIPAYDAGVLTASRELADYYEVVAKDSGDSKAASNLIMGEVLREIKEKQVDITEYPVSAERLAELVKIQVGGSINSSTAKSVLKEMLGSAASASEIIKSKGLEQISDDSAIESMASDILEGNPDEVGKYLAGKEKLMGFFVGQLMKASRGKANPKMATDIFTRLLNAKR